jgi:hypothetical protein
MDRRYATGAVDTRAENGSAGRKNGFGQFCQMLDRL